MKHDRGTSITRTRGPPIAIKSTCFIKRSITVLIKWRGAHLDHPIAIQGAQFKGVLKCISNGSSGPSISDLTDLKYSKRSTMDRSIVIVDRFDLTVTPKCTIKRHVLRCSKHSSWKSKQLIYLDTSPLVSLDLIVFYSHFRTYGALEIEIWLSRLGEIDAWISSSRSSCSSRLSGLIRTI